MRTSTLLLFGLLCIPRTGAAQEPIPSGGPMSQRAPTLPTQRLLNLEIREQQYEVGAWIALAVANSGVAVFDAYYTRRIVSVGGVEQNPLVRPFVRSKALYLVNQTAPVIADLIGLWLLKNHRGWGRSIWWLPQIGYIFVNGAVLIDNFRNDG